jgi:sialidase-1
LEGILKQMYAANPKANVVMMAFAEPKKNDDYEAGKEPVEVGSTRDGGKTLWCRLH